MAAHPASNPAPDSYGHNSVWSYQQGQYAAGDSPGTNSALSSYTSSLCNDDTSAVIDTWQDSGQDWAPLVEFRPCNGQQVAFAHPGPTTDAVIAWTAPVSSVVNISGSVASLDAGGGDGVNWLLFNGTTLIESGAVDSGGTGAILKISGLTVQAGQQIYLHVNAGPNNNTDHDSTGVDLTISGSSVAPTATGTSVKATPDLPAAGTPTTLSAAVTPNPGGGTVRFTDGGSPISGCEAAAVDTTTGTATCSTGFGSEGSHLIVAQFQGFSTSAANFAASSSPPQSLSVAHSYRLNGVACPTAAGCVLAGTADQDLPGSAPSGVLGTLGNAFSAMVPGRPAGSSGNDFWGISCPSVAVCMAVGDASVQHADRGYVQKLASGVPGQMKILPVPVGAASTHVLSISCATTTDCQAVGYWTDHAGKSHALIEVLSKSGWAVSPGTEPASGKLDGLASVSCAGVGSCRAVGSQNATIRLPMIATLANGKWTRKVLTKSAASGLTGVSCPSATWCVAVGTMRQSGKDHALTATLSGGAWTVKVLPLSGGDTAEMPTGVSCWTAHACMAVGSAGVAGRYVPLATQLSKSGWQVTTAPPLSGSESDFTDAPNLEAVSCANAFSCTAVGERVEPTGSGLIEQWNGTSWSAS